MTEQEIFNMAYIGLAKQGFERSFDDETKYCLYRGPDGRKCALGHCIPDEIYDDELESIALAEVVEKIPDLSGVDIFFLENLRNCHDKGTSPIVMTLHLSAFAEESGLSIPKVDE